jgi:hypothetical protein
MGQFDKETTRQNYEWHRERLLREKQKPNAESGNRVDFNLREIAKNHGDKAAKEAAKEFNSKPVRGKKYYT